MKSGGYGRGNSEFPVGWCYTEGPRVKRSDGIFSHRNILPEIFTVFP